MSDFFYEHKTAPCLLKGGGRFRGGRLSKQYRAAPRVEMILKIVRRRGGRVASSDAVIQFSLFVRLRRWSVRCVNPGLPLLGIVMFGQEF